MKFKVGDKIKIKDLYKKTIQDAYACSYEQTESVFTISEINDDYLFYARSNGLIITLYKREMYKLNTDTEKVCKRKANEIQGRR